jgi:nucleotide-binding universal stress UspA family protein
MRDPRRILVATDFSRDAERALDIALEIAARAQSEVHLVHALTLPSTYYAAYEINFPSAFDQAEREAALALLAEAEARVRAAGCIGTSRLGFVPAAQCIAEHAGRIGADLVVVGSHGRSGWRRAVLGSVAEATVKQCPVSVLTVRGEGRAEAPRTIVAGTDFSAPARRALEVAASWARGFGARLHLVHALEPPVTLVTRFELPARDDLPQRARELAAERLAALAKELGGVDVRTEVVAQAPHAALDAVAQRERADLIVTGSRGLGGVAHALLGSVAERTLRHAPCSVLTVKAKFD